MRNNTLKSKCLFAFLIGSMLCISIYSFAQQPMQRMTPEERAERQTEMMQKNMNLDADQTAKVKDINLKYAQKNAEIMKTGPDAREAHKQLMQDKEAEMKDILTADQFAQYQKMEQMMRQRMQNRMQHANNTEQN